MDGKHVAHINEYFGTRIYLYFRFVQHYSKWLFVPAAVGIPVQISIGMPTVICPQCSAGQYNSVSLPFFAFLCSIWSVIMLEVWTRDEKVISLQVGSLNYKENEQDR